MDDLQLRHRIYRRLAATGRAPSVAEVGELVGGQAEAARRLRRLHDAHMIVLDEDGEIRMALPFSARPAPHVVVSGEQRWWANCAWDSLAIPVALGRDAAVEAVWLDTGEPVELAVRDGELEGPDGFVHFVVRAGRWWDDIVET